MTSRLRLSIALTGSLLAAGCSFSTFDRPGTFSTKNQAGLEVPAGAPMVSGESCERIALMFIPVGIGQAESAFKEALSKAPGADTLVNFRVEANLVMVTPLYRETCVTVRGQAIDSNKLVASAEQPEAARSFVAHWRDLRDRARTTTDMAPSEEPLPRVAAKR